MASILSSAATILTHMWWFTNKKKEWKITIPKDWRTAAFIGVQRRPRSPAGTAFSSGDGVLPSTRFSGVRPSKGVYLQQSCSTVTGGIRGGWSIRRCGFHNGGSGGGSSQWRKRIKRFRTQEKGIKIFRKKNNKNNEIWPKNKICICFE